MGPALARTQCNETADFCKTANLHNCRSKGRGCNDSKQNQRFDRLASVVCALENPPRDPTQAAALQPLSPGPTPHKECQSHYFGHLCLNPPRMTQSSRLCDQESSLANTHPGLTPIPIWQEPCQLCQGDDTHSCPSLSWCNQPSERNAARGQAKGRILSQLIKATTCSSG